MVARGWAPWLAFLLYYTTRVVCQLPQDYTVRVNAQGGKEYWIIPEPGAQWTQVLDFDDVTVYLVYNCHYMREICKNAKAFLASTRGQNLHADSTLDNPDFQKFGYDSSVGESATRDSKRRGRSCPGNWKDNHPCPESDQSKPMRNDGEWFTSALESQTTNNAIANMYDSNGNLLAESHIRYSCEEFPAASWVEGGDGENNNNPAFTRCAAITCAGAPKGTKAEQTWQSTAHGGVARELRRAAGASWVRHQSIAFFTFMTYEAENGLAAEVLVTNNDNGETERQEVYVDRDKRDVTNKTVDLTEKQRADARYAWLMAKVAAGNATRYVVHANMSGTSLVEVAGTGGASDRHSRARGPAQSQAEHDSVVQPWSLGNGALQSVDRPAPRYKARAARHDPFAVDLAHPATAPLLKRATPEMLERAREVVANAIAESARRNEARYLKPARKTYSLKPGTIVGGATAQKQQSQRRDRRGGLLSREEEEAAPPLLVITDEIAQAAALVAEAEASNDLRSSNVTRRQAPAGTFWMEKLARKGTVPWGDSSTYAVFRNVRDYGATGNGVTDDTAAIKRAMNDGNRCGEKCNGSTTKNAIVYFPPGTYLVSTTIPLPFGTQVIGDAINRPLLLASPSFVGLGVLSTDEYTGGDGGAQQWFINTANFYRQLRNIRIDVTGTDPAQKIACLHYQVAQATSTQNVELIAGAAQTGMFAENGSGGGISDITFTGGAYGIYGGEQQFTAQRLTFNGCNVGVQVIWDWGWVWKSITMTNVGTGFRLLPEAGQTGNIGSAAFLDSSFTNVATAIEIAPPSSLPGTGTTGIVLENVGFSGVTKAVADTGGATLLAGTAGKVEHWALGPVYAGDGTRTFTTGSKIGNYRRVQQLIDSATGAYFERPRPQYETNLVDDFLHVKDFGATGNGVTDDTAAFQRALYAAQGKILFVDAGSYILTSTLVVPTGSKIVGETWSQLVAFGPYFQDASNPKVLLQVGDKGQIGTAELQDLIITTKGPTAGAILIEWNMRASAAGLAAMWDVHVRIGGATGTGLTPDECPAITNGVNANCNAASLMMHITPSGSGYFENIWLWLSDHDIDDPDLADPGNDMVQNSVYAARGFLIESTHATWLYGTASEHAVYYQYNFHKARNVFAAMIQTESPYYQPTPPPPAPFANQVGILPGDPDYTCAPNDEFSGCDQSWALIIRESSDISITGAGLYTWFSTYTQTCIDTQECQKALVLLDDNGSSVRIQHLVTIGAKYMAVMNGVGITAADNINTDVHPFWSQISVLDVTSDGAQYNDLIWIDPQVWEMAQPEFTCIPPCHVQLPPWTRATTTINYPLLTVSSLTWTSTITIAPLTISEWRFERVTITAAGGGGAKKRQQFGDFFPVPAATSTWPAVIFTGPDGSPTTVAPTGAMPTPPPSIGPNAPAPPEGFWPPVALRAVSGNVARPVVDECSFYGEGCEVDPLSYGGVGIDDPDDNYDENWSELGSTCPAAPPKTSTSTPAVYPTPAAPAMAHPSPAENKVSCYNSGLKADNADLAEVAARFCDVVGAHADFWGRRPAGQDYNIAQSFTPSKVKAMSVAFKFNLQANCDWSYSRDECLRYLRNPVDACNCGGVNGKQGGSTSNNCLTFGIDPNLVSYSGGGSPFDTCYTC